MWHIRTLCVLDVFSFQVLFPMIEESTDERYEKLFNIYYVY